MPLPVSGVGVTLNVSPIQSACNGMVGRLSFFVYPFTFRFLELS